MKLGVYQVFANSEMRGDPEGLFDFTENLPDRHIPYAQNALRMCEAWAPGCFACCNISHQSSEHKI